MITKAQLLERARIQGLRPTTIEKDYVLGWILAAISKHPRLSEWVFKGGTCLKKCFFETYRFSEDLDFTIPTGIPLSPETIKSDLEEVGDWVEEQTGIRLPADKIRVEIYTNPRGRTSYQAKVAYACRLNISGSNLQRIKFDITQDELLADTPDLRVLSHPYGDAEDPAPLVHCYSVDEILAEKTRALYEREGRARDVYDLVHLSRDFRGWVYSPKASDILRRKFEFKELPSPTVKLIIDRVNEDTLRANWEHQLDHQLPKLPPVDGFLSDLGDAIAWWLEPERAKQLLPAIATKSGETPVPRQLLPTLQRISYDRSTPDMSSVGDMGRLDKIRYAARNRLCAEIRYNGASRIVEPYSLRYASTGNTLLYVHELLKDGHPVGQVRAYNVVKIESAAITNSPFQPRHRVEL